MIAGDPGFGKPILWLFGPGFQAGDPLMFILAIALVARAAVGPAERVLNMLGEQRRCALVYAAVFDIEPWLDASRWPARTEAWALPS